MVVPRLRLLVLTLLACTAGGGGASVCDKANCGKGSCTEVPGPLPPNYECHCDPGWSQALKLFPFSPCIIPNCSFDGTCLNITLKPPTSLPPKDVCAVVGCGVGGACRAGVGDLFSYTCECQPGYANMLNLTALPCVKDCFFGNDCYALGLGPAPPSPAPSGDHGSPGPTAPPSGTNNGNGTTTNSLGSILLLNQLQLLLLLLLVTVTMLQAV